MMLTLAGVLDKVGLPSHLLLASIPFALIAACMAALAGAKRGWRMWLCIPFALVLGAHLWLLIVFTLIDHDIAGAATNEYRYATGRDFQVDMLLAFAGSVLTMPIVAVSAFKGGQFIARSRQATIVPGA